MELTLALIGFGNVGRALMRLMQRKHDDLRERHNLTWRVTGISTGRHGLAADPAGLDVNAALAAVESGEKLDSLNRLPDAIVYDNFSLIRSEWRTHSSSYRRSTHRPVSPRSTTAALRSTRGCTSSRPTRGHWRIAIASCATAPPPKAVRSFSSPP